MRWHGLWGQSTSANSAVIQQTLQARTSDGRRRPTPLRTGGLGTIAKGLSRLFHSLYLDQYGPGRDDANVRQWMGNALLSADQPEQSGDPSLSVCSSEGTFAVRNFNLEEAGGVGSGCGGYDRESVRRP